jgi:poly(A) polymerase
MKVLSLVEKRTHNLNVLWGALLHDIGKPATEKFENGVYSNHGHDEVGAKIAVDILRRLKAPNSQIEEVEFLVSQHMRIKNAPEMRKSKIARLKAEKYYEDLKLLSECDSLATGIEENLNWVYALDEVEEYKELPKPLVNGNDLISFGMKPGSAIGRILSILMDYQLEGKYKDREDALHDAKILVFKEKQMEEIFEYNMSQLFE